MEELHEVGEKKWRVTHREAGWTTATVAGDVLEACQGDRLLLFFLLETPSTLPLAVRCRKARARHRAVRRIYRRVGPPQPRDALRIGPDRPCIFPLEDDSGACVRTLGGRPVIVQLGVCLVGDSDAWIRQFCLAQDRLSQVIQDDEVPHPVVIIDAAVRSKLWVTPAYLSFLVAQPNHAHIYVVGVSETARRFAEWLLYPLPRHLTERVSLHAGYAILATLLAPNEGLAHWGLRKTATEGFDPEAYGRRISIELQAGWRSDMPWWTAATDPVSDDEEEETSSDEPEE